jgi:hypothetical protein
LTRACSNFYTLTISALGSNHKEVIPFVSVLFALFSLNSRIPLDQ